MAAMTVLRTLRGPLPIALRFVQRAFFLLVSLCAGQAWAQTAVSGAVTVDSHWTLDGSPYLVSGNLVIQNGAILTIDAGVIVYMGAAASVTVQSGGIKAQGTASSPIRVLSDKTRLAAPSAPGDWGQWVFTAGTVNTRLDYVLLQHGNGLVVNGSAPVFNHLDVRNQQGAAITIDLAASPSGMGNQASGNTVNGIAVPAGDITGSVSWALRGIPYVVASGAVSIGSSPAIGAISPSTLQQGDTVTVDITGSRLTGLALASFNASGLSAQILPGATSTHVALSVSAAATASVGAAMLTLLVDAGEIRIPGAISVERSRPMIASLDPASLFVAQGAADVLVNGRNFSSQASVLANGAPVPTQFLSATQLRASIADQSSAGTLLLRVRAPDPLNPGQFQFSDEAGLPVIARQLALAPATLSVPSGSSGTLTLSLQQSAPAGGLTVDLVSSAPAIASVPATLTVLQGQTSASFQVTGAGIGAAAISASRVGFVGAQAQVSVTAVCLAPLSGLIGWWTGDGTAGDSAGNRDGQLLPATNGPTFAAGKIGKAFSLNGINNYVNLGPAAAPALGDFTLHAWVSTDPALNTGEKRIVGFDDINLPVGRQYYDLKSSSPFTCGGASGRPALQISTGGSQICAPSPLTAGFHHLAGVRAGSALLLYVDGVLVAQGASSPGVISPTAPLVIGQVSPSFNGEFFNGLIDEVAVHNRALTSNEILALATGIGTSGMCKPVGPRGDVLTVTRPLSVFVPGPSQAAPAGDSLSVTRPLSVFVPGPTQAAPAGDAMTVGRPMSVFVPGPTQVAPSGDAITVGRTLSVFVPGPTQVAPSGDAMSIAKPLSVRMP
jgi:hypothetical protein